MMLEFDEEICATCGGFGDCAEGTCDEQPTDAREDRWSTSATDMPNAEWYVSMTDRFMSGWGRAQGMTNTHVILCDDIHDADRIERRASEREEMERVTITRNKPRTRSGVLYSWQHVSENRWVA